MTFIHSTTTKGYVGVVAKAQRRKSSTPLLFIHGAFGTHDNFTTWLKYFCDAGFDGYAYSLRGRLGVNPPQAKGVRLNQYLEDVHIVLASLEKKPIVFGHSMGGLLAQKVAEQGGCVAAVLITPAPPAPLTVQLRSFTSFLPLMPSVLSGKSILPSEKTLVTVAVNRVEKEQQSAIIKHLVHESGIVYRDMIFGSMTIDRNKVRCPVLCIGAEDDRIISQRLLRLTAKKCNADLRIYPNHGHWILDEPNWEEIAGDILKWIEQRIGQSS